MDEDKPKIIKIDVVDQSAVSDAMVGTGQSPTDEGIRAVDSEGHSVGIDQTGEGIREIIAGPTIQNEQGTKPTCEILMNKLNELGGDWVRLESPTDDPAIDGHLYSRGQEIKPLDINVTKADATIWGELAKSPAGVSRTRSIDAVCDSLLQRIMSKKDVSKGPNLVLALEAVHFPVTKPVADRFVEKYKHISGAVGFSQIWLVGPTVSLTHQLA